MIEKSEYAKMQEERQLKRLMRTIGIDKMKEMEAMTAEQLEQVIINSEKLMADAKNEVAVNPAYVAARNAISDFSAGLREVNKVNNAQIAFALNLLDSHGRI